MSTEDLASKIFGWVGTGLSLIFYIAPCVPFYRVIKGTLPWDDAPGVLLICSFLNCILWSDYGLLREKFSVYLANGLGGTITLIYITIYLIHFAGRKVLLSLFYNFFLMCCIVEIYFIFFYFVPSKATGIIANIFNVLMYAAPGEKIVKICKGGSYQLIPIWSTLGGILCSTSWMCYGIYQKDELLIIPNALGVAASIVQIVVFFVYKHKQKNAEVSPEPTKE